jgi:PAS domain S-box-containing protein
MTAIIRALHCDRAAILLFDETGVMRFAASRDLSESYCRAVEGHSPWSADCTNAEPICANTVASADLPQSLKETLRSEGIAALAFIPLKEHGRLIGKFMVYHDSPHVFDVSEIEAGLAIARQLVFGLERRRAEEAVQRLATIVESSDDAIVSKNLDGIILTWNRGAERIFGYKAEEVIGQPVTVLIPPDRFDEEPGILARLRRGEPIDHYETIRRRKDGTLIDVSLTVSPVKDTTGRVIGASKIARDITERKRAEATLRDSARHLQNLLAASRRPSTQPTLPGRSRTTMRRRSNLPGGGRR